MHDGEGLGVEASEGAEDGFGLSGVGQVAGEGALLHLLHGLACGFDEVGVGEGFDVAEVVEEVGAEEGLLGLFEEDAGVPAMGQVGRAVEAVAVLAGGEEIVGGHAEGGSEGEVVDADEFADEGADGLGVGGDFQPMVE